jgi:hypothetical protein
VVHAERRTRPVPRGASLAPRRGATRGPGGRQMTLPIATDVFSTRPPPWVGGGER